MERVRPRAALEPQVMAGQPAIQPRPGAARRPPLFVWLGAALFGLTNAAGGHGCEFLVARLEVRPEGVELAITADFIGNPLLADATAAKAALRQSLQVRLDGRLQPLEKLAPLQFREDAGWDPEAPAAFAPPADAPAHPLLTAVWRWRPDRRQLAFGVPDGHLHDVLLWTRDPALPGRQTKWMLLIEGEDTPAIAWATPTPLWPWGLTLPALGLLWWWRRRG